MSYQEHVFVCLNERPDDMAGCCAGRGSAELFQQLRAEFKGRKDIRINKSGCLGRCAEGPVIVRYPSAEWLTGADAAACAVLAARLKDRLAEYKQMDY